ncbi:MAG TPA: OmpA family protein [Bacteroidia bacterium]|nr:OmpA family protein [Bacteroidia bacterium]
MSGLVKHILWVMAFTGFSVLSQAQDEKEKDKCHHADDKKAIALYEKGCDTKKYKREERIAFFTQALEIDPEYTDVYYKLGQMQVTIANLHQESYKAAVPHFKKLIELCPTYHSDPFYYVGYTLYEEEKYDEAVKYLQKYLDFKDDDPKKYNKDFEFFQSNASQMIRFAKVYDELKKNIVPFDPKPVPGICTERDEYLGLISPDNEQMYFTRRGFQSSFGQAYQTDRQVETFMYARRDKTGTFNAGEKMPSPFNTYENQGGATVSIDNKHMYFTIGKDEGGDKPNFDIYYCDKENGRWGDIKNCGLPLNDASAWDSQPSISADGKTLYFASDRAGGYGGSDIWCSHRKANGTWDTPINLGPKINTKGEEKTPFIHSDSETLYFSSDGLPGVGGQDIFYVRKDDKGQWEDPKNIGIPINTSGDDVGFFVSTDGHYGYFASNQRQKNPGMGGYDIYTFELYEKARPQRVAFVRGELKNENGAPPGAFKMEIKSANSKTKTEVVVDTITGQYSAVVNMKKKEDFIITVKKSGAAFSSQLVSADSVSSKPKDLNLEVYTATTGIGYKINNLYYRSNSAELEGRSKIVLEEFASYLKENPKIKIEIHGHTDNVGDPKTNMGLSTDRALTVYETLENLGVPKAQLAAYKGFGSSQPVADNATEAGRGKNRRTEFFVLSR